MDRHLAFVSLPAHGHVNPALPVVAELVRRGWRVSYVDRANGSAPRSRRRARRWSHRGAAPVATSARAGRPGRRSPAS